MSLNLLTFEGKITWAPSLAVASLGPMPQRRHHKDYLRPRIRNVELTIPTTNAELEASVVTLSLTLDSQLDCTKWKYTETKVDFWLFLFFLLWKILQTSGNKYGGFQVYKIRLTGNHVVKGPLEDMTRRCMLAVLRGMGTGWLRNWWTLRRESSVEAPVDAPWSKHWVMAEFVLDADWKLLYA